ncbi:hypothetical protein L195_g038864, partial [Trifolium pratense]
MIRLWGECYRVVEWIRGYAKNVGRCNAFETEFRGVLEDSRCVRTMGFKKVELDIDSASVVQMLKVRYFHSLTGRTVVHQIWKLLDLGWDI